VVKKKRRPQTAYRIIYAPEVADHLSRFTKRGQAMIMDAVPRQLGHEPTVPTRNRKPLEANPLAPWELRIGEYRVYFDVKEEPERVVRIVAVGLKDRDRVLIGGIEVRLR
jgi:mRNA-degrading endonuclease RelE of RelBE toxin-antitoxin system